MKLAARLHKEIGMDEITKLQLDTYARLVIQQERLIQIQLTCMELQNKAFRAAITPIVTFQGVDIEPNYN